MVLLVLSGILKKSGTATDIGGAGAVTVENGVQVIDLTANGGYSPRYIVAQAGMPTELHVITNGTYDCSSSIVIPALGYQKLLAPTGEEKVEISADQASGTLRGTCGMGMYSFEIAFK